MMAKGRHYVRSVKDGARKKGKAPFVIAGIVVLLVLIVAAAFALRLCDSDTTGQVRQGEEIEVVIPAGATTNDIAVLLVDKGVIASSKAFVNRVQDLGQASKLQSGSYLLVGGSSLDDIIKILATGQTGRQLVIPEGFTAKQIAAKVEQACGVSADEFYALTLQASRYAGDFPFLNGVYNDSMEGFLYPDTYRVDPDATADEVVRMMLARFAEQIATVDMSYAESKNLTLYDLVTLASIVEKEFKIEEDKAPIAAVFYNRLHENIPLGSDVTTYYAVDKDMTEALTVSDLASDSPYNTRNPNHYGLPAGPICNPSVSTINAAAHPAQVDYLYFFYSNREGKTMFFKTDADFNAAWAQYGD